MMNEQRPFDYEGLQRLVAAMERMQPIRIELDPNVALGLVGQLQLALRHPRNTGATAGIMRNLVEDLKGYFPAEVRPLLDRGDDPAFDV